MTQLLLHGGVSLIELLQAAVVSRYKLNIQLIWGTEPNRVCRQSAFPTFISCQHQDPNVLPKRRQSHQGDKLCDVSMVPLVARWPIFLARGSDTDGEPHSCYWPHAANCVLWHDSVLRCSIRATTSTAYLGSLTAIVEECSETWTQPDLLLGNN